MTIISFFWVNKDIYFFSIFFLERVISKCKQQSFTSIFREVNWELRWGWMLSLFILFLSKSFNCFNYLWVVLFDINYCDLGRKVMGCSWFIHSVLFSDIDKQQKDPQSCMAPRFGGFIRIIHSPLCLLCLVHIRNSINVLFINKQQN